MGGRVLVEREVEGNAEVAILAAVGVEFLLTNVAAEGARLSRCRGPSFLPEGVEASIPPLAPASLAVGKDLVALLTCDRRIMTYAVADGGHWALRDERTTGASTRGVALSADGAFLATIATEAAAIHDLELGMPIRTVPGGGGAVVAFHPSGSHVAVADGRTVRLAPLGDGGPTVEVQCDEPVRAIGFTADGQWLWAVTPLGADVFVWRGPSPPALHHRAWGVTAISAYREGRYLLVGDPAGRVSRLDPLSGASSDALALGDRLPVRALAITGDGQHFAALQGTPSARLRLVVAAF